MNPYDIEIKVAAIGLNRADLYIQKGMYRKGAKPGMEVSGTITRSRSKLRVDTSDRSCTRRLARPSPSSQSTCRPIS